MPRPERPDLLLAELVTRPGAHIGSGVACVLLGELQALRDGAAELARKWRQQWEDSGHDHEFLSCEPCADDLDKLMRGES